MSVFSQAVNGFRSTASRASKFYNSMPAKVGMRNSKVMAYAPKIGAAGAAAGAVGGAMVGGKDHRTSGAMKGAGLGALAGISKWKNMSSVYGSGVAGGLGRGPRGLLR
jgi:hypothetical protein